MPSKRAAGHLDGSTMTDDTPGAADGTIDDAPSEPDRVVTLGFHLGVRVQAAVSQHPPDARVPEEFAVNVFVPNADGRNVDVVRIDTAHAGCHVDRLYLPADDPRRRRDYGVTLFSPRGALRFLVEDDRWRRFLERYAENHELPESLEQWSDES